MSVIRVNKTKDYTIMSNRHLKEKEMSLKAKGLLSIMLSLPDDWDYSIRGLVAICKESKDSIMSTLKELEKFGYLVRTRVVNKNGQFAGYDYDIYENPHTEKPYSENPHTDNPPQLKTKELNTNLLNTNKYISEETSPIDYSEFDEGNPPHAPKYKELVEYVFEKGYTFDVEAFFLHYGSIGWVDDYDRPIVWKARCKDWQRMEDEK